MSRIATGTEPPAIRGRARTPIVEAATMVRRGRGCFRRPGRLHLARQPAAVDERDPWLVSFRDRIGATHTAFLAAQNLCVATVGNRNDAMSYLKAEKRLWIQALSVCRMKAGAASLGDDAYVRAIFAPAPSPMAQPAPIGAGLQVVEAG